ncbi:J domain-containing protein [Sulfurovum sp. zt1-1]|uniref:J domain-containing protein n=1 Tax=Sulfurovum zhangzhouensis TaxID=3019067 RepID=A0ABT7QXY4_9BACT|nr:J domain-containing protein [Sulfurovum zhangzhouensis]MDM5271698.1 J domain-containing protein [Sulfurovum zhangzhouensis]
MHYKGSPIEEVQWIIWNGTLGISDLVTIGRIEEGPEGINVWLEVPYDMVGPLSLEELEKNGLTSFAACMVMSRERWQKDQVQFRQEAIQKHREAQQKLFEDLVRSNAKKRRQATRIQLFNEQEYRELLCLPIEGELEEPQINSAYRKLVKKAHPDVGGSHELFLQITEARDALLKVFL